LIKIKQGHLPLYVKIEAKNSKLAIIFIIELKRRLLKK